MLTPHAACEQCREFLTEQMAQKGVNVHPGSSPTEIVKNEGGTFTLKFDTKEEGSKEITCDAVMMATGEGHITCSIMQRPDGSIMGACCHAGFSFADYFAPQQLLLVVHRPRPQDREPWPGERRSGDGPQGCHQGLMSSNSPWLVEWQ